MTSRAPASANGDTRATVRGELTTALSNDVDAHVEEWDALARATGAPPFARPGWIRAWVDAFSDGRKLVLATAREGTALVAAVPLLEQGATLNAPANWHTPEAALVASSTDALAAALEAALSRAPRRVVFRFVPEANAAVIRDALSAAGYRVRDRTLQVSPYAQLDQGGHRTEAGAPPTGDIGRKWRRLLELGALELDDRDGTRDLEELLDEGFRLEASGWKDAVGTAIVSQERTRQFYSEIAAWGARAGLLSLAFLRLDGRALAFQFGLRTAADYYFLKGGYDPEYRRYSPGKLLHARMIEALGAQGVVRYDFLGNTEAYKRLWSGDARPFLEVAGYKRSVAGTVDSFATARIPELLRRLKAGLARGSGDESADRPR